MNFFLGQLVPSLVVAALRFNAFLQSRLLFLDQFDIALKQWYLFLGFLVLKRPGIIPF